MMNKLFGKTQTQNHNSNELSFIFDDNKIPHIKIVIHNYDPIDAKEFGNILFMLNNGYLMSSILETLISLAKDNLEINNFIQQVVSHWTALDTAYKNQYSNTTAYKNDDQPKVKPTEFLERFKNGS